jgi:hypothetical protein
VNTFSDAPTARKLVQAGLAPNGGVLKNPHHVFVTSEFVVFVSVIVSWSED